MQAPNAFPTMDQATQRCHRVRPFSRYCVKVAWLGPAWRSGFPGLETEDYFDAMVQCRRPFSEYPEIPYVLFSELETSGCKRSIY